jgi:ABC-type transport system involved in cytochrome bd biosynthesis fused ATPase/permease subunit
MKTAATEDSHTAEYRRGPTWRGWVLSILAAIILSVTATLLLGGSGAFRSDSAIGPATGHSGIGAGSGCCPPADEGK